MAPAQPDTRVPVDLDLRVWGMAADGRVFSQHARALNVSKGGAMLSDIERDLKIGDTIAVQREGMKARCKVVWALNTRSNEKIRVGVQLLTEQDCPWRALLPTTSGPVQSMAKGQRRWERHKIPVLITLHEQRSPSPLRVTATDISASGCYVETLAPFPVGTSLIADLCFAADSIMTRTIVRAYDPGVGMGIEFMGLKREEQLRFQEYLRAKNPFWRSIEHKTASAGNPQNN